MIYKFNSGCSTHPLSNIIGGPASHWSKNKWWWWGGGGGDGGLDPTAPSPYPHTTFANFFLFDKGEHMVSSQGLELVPHW